MTEFNSLIDPEWSRKALERYKIRLKKKREESKNRISERKIVTTPSNPETTPRQGMIYVPTIDLYFEAERSCLGKNWYETHDALKQENLRMPTLPEFAEFLKYVKDNNQELYNEITEVRSPWRSNWIDAYFEQKDDGMYVLTGNKTKPEKLQDCLMEDKQISLEDFLNNPTKQGLPREDVNTGSFYFWNPRDKRVAWFGAGSGRAFLNCGGGPRYSYSDLGVFGCAEGTKNL